MAKPPVLYSFTGLKDIIWHQGYQMENILGWGLDTFFLKVCHFKSHCERLKEVWQSHSCKIQSNPSLGYSIHTEITCLLQAGHAIPGS
jgi:hypothetical protein